MEDIIKKISNTLTLVIAFFVSAMFYFNYKGFVYEDGKIFLKPQEAKATEMNGIASVLPKDIALNVSYKFAEGSEKAPLTMYEFSSFGCPHCADFHLDTMPKLKRDFMDKGLLRVVFVNFPLDKQSMKVAMLSECMTYENYTSFVDNMFSEQRSWWQDTDNERLFQYAAEYGLSYDEAQRCIGNDAVARDIVSLRQDAMTRLGIQGTPAFMISGADGNEIIYGARGYDEVKNYIESRLLRLQK
ncbi:MAG: thioredoxin domain-containing protein [Alphaproteobacteria bacterium]|nr:thioredoxin domain-containing protein [Alphaproteobacteria bacterium]